MPEGHKGLFSEVKDGTTKAGFGALARSTSEDAFRWLPYSMREPMIPKDLGRQF